MTLKGAGRFKAAWVLVFFMVAVAGQEVALRLAMPSVNPANHIRFIRGAGDRPILGPVGRTFRQIKNTGDFDVTVNFNRYGLREKKDIAGATNQDIFLVGDSFAFGWGVEESERVSNRLADLTGRRVFNISVTGNFDTYEKLLDYAASKGAEVEKVIIMVTMENDLSAYAGKPTGKTQQQPVSRTPRGLSYLSVKELLLTNSALYFLLTSTVHNIPWIRDLAQRLGIIAANLDDKRRPVPSPADIRSSSERLQAIARRFDTTIAIIPSRALWYGTRTEALSAVHEDFIGRLEKLDMDVVDLRTVFEKPGAPLTLHFANDPHWTAEGHRVAAAAIAKHMQTSGAGIGGVVK